MSLPSAALFICLLPVFQVLSAPVNSSNPPNGTCLYNGLTMADPADPTAYFLCYHHHWVIEYCPQGDVFDKYSLTCIANHPTAPTTTLYCIPGTRLPNAFDPTAYDVCVNGTHYETRYCPRGNVYNSNTQQCQPLPTTPACFDGDTLPNQYGDPSSYLFCDHGSWVIRYCDPDLLYQPTLKKCIAPYTTSSPMTTSTNSPFVDGTCQESAGVDGFRPNPADCRTYFQCVHSQWMLRDCGPGTRWVQAILGCDYYYGQC